jgi:glycosyltransferase involved in cell wall biosynthesis
MTRGIKFVSLHEPSGYGMAGQRYLAGLAQSPIPVTWTPMVNGTAWGLWYVPFTGRNLGSGVGAQLCNIEIEYDTVILHTVPEYYPLWAKKETGKRLVGCTVWETDRPPRHWIPLLNALDLVLVPCDWNREALKRGGVTTPIAVIPHIASPINDSCRTVGWPGLRSTDYVFYTINTWTIRKALWHTIRAYLDTFTGADPTVLLVKTSQQDFTKKIFKRYWARSRNAIRSIVKQFRNPARIVTITDTLTDEQMTQIHRRSDCYVSLTRSEGWGMGAFDAAAHGKPVIITGFGGQLDYLPPEHAYLVDYQLIGVDDPFGGNSYTPDQRWAEPSIAEAGRLMRQVFENRTEAATKGANLRRYVQVHFNAQTVTHKLLSILYPSDSPSFIMQADAVSQPAVAKIVPNQFHFVYGLREQTEPFHLAHYLCIESCLRINRPDKVYFYYHYEPFGRYWDLIKEKIQIVPIDFDPMVSRFHYRDPGVKQFSYAHHSDFIRLRELLRRGGIYADIDTIFVNPLPKELYTKSFVLGKEGDIVCQKTHRTKPSLCNAFIMSRKDAPFGVTWLEQMGEAFDGTWSNHSTLLPQRLSTQYPELIHIEPEKTFYKHRWTREGIHTLLQGCDPNFDGVVSMHLWAHLWWSKKRDDFSDFHSGKLTERVIRRIDTTYNIVARPFLPARVDRRFWRIPFIANKCS